MFHENIDPEIQVLNMREFEFQQLLEFVQNGLTDPRVRSRAAALRPAALGFGEVAAVPKVCGRDSRFHCC